MSSPRLCSKTVHAKCAGVMHDNMPSGNWVVSQPYAALISSARSRSDMCQGVCVVCVMCTTNISCTIVAVSYAVCPVQVQSASL